MKTRIVLFSAIIFFSVHRFTYACEDLVKVRKMCETAFLENSPEELDNFLMTQSDNNPVFNGYRSLVLILHSKISTSPVEKIKYFRKGKNLLENTIRNNAGTAELRYLRFCIQTNIPFFLFYDESIEEDKKFIMAKWSELTDQDLKNRIKKCMSISEYCSTPEKNFFING